MKTTILLTGSEGYIGKNFFNQYKDQFNFIEVDRKTGTEVLDVKDFTGVCHIVHLAGIAGIVDCEKDKEQAIIDNVTSTIYLMKMSDHFDIPMVFASSQGAKVPDNLYSITKRICELEAEQYNHIRVLRFANVYGGIDYLETKSSVVAQFLNAKINNEPLVIKGNGGQKRDFVHVDDISRAIYESLDKELPGPIDVGTGIGTSIRVLAYMISHNTIYKKGDNIGVESNIANTSDIEKYLGFKPGYDKLLETCVIRSIGKGDWVMDYNKFKHYMGSIRKSLEMEDKYSEIMSDDFLDDMSGHLIDDVIELIEDALGTDLVSWYVFETGFGKKNYEISIDDECIQVRNVKDLWNIIKMAEV